MTFENMRICTDWCVEYWCVRVCICVCVGGFVSVRVCEREIVPISVLRSCACERVCLWVCVREKLYQLVC